MIPYSKPQESLPAGSTSLSMSPVLIMAGGIGSRLRPLTNQTPKPMLSIGGRPLLEIMIEQFKREGFQNILLSVHYQKEVIQRYFGSGDDFGVNISYIEEKQPLGTAGAILLAKPHLRHPFYVMNGDILTKNRFRRMMEFHLERRSALTLGVTSYAVQIPYGVVDRRHHKVLRIREKPECRFDINGGIYCMNPDVVSYIPPSVPYNMNQLIDGLIRDKQATASYPIDEYWLDIGRIHDYEKANADYSLHFGDRQITSAYAEGDS